MQIFRHINALPEHVSMLQSSDSVGKPTQFSPIHDRVLVRVPPPHSTLHVPQLFQSAQVPLK